MNPALEAYPLRGNATFSAAVRAGSFLFVSGMTAVDDDKKIVGDDLEAQARFIYGKLAAVLAQAGADMGDVVETTEYVTTFDGYEKTAAVRREVFGTGPFPAATGIKVSGLVRAGALIEIRAIAWIGPRSEGAGR
jgi:aminoacrylate peracid reductase